MSKLALLGGVPVRENAMPWVNIMGDQETAAVLSVMETGELSGFIGRAGAGFLGGPKVKEIERDFAAKFGSKYGISVNSATTALHTAIAACEIGPGDEVLVTPFTMVATASAVLMNNAVPIFVDICPKTYNMDPNQIDKWISPRTKAIVVTNLFGLPANLPEILSIARKHGLYVIEDNAQSPGASINGKFAGAFGDLSIFSLNYHKVIHCGEGGIILTHNPDLANRCQLIRNHGEMVLDDLNDMATIILGSNYRMSELHAAIGVEQLKKLDSFLLNRRELASKVTSGLTYFEGLDDAFVPRGYEHSYYVYPIKFHRNIWGISRKTFADAMSAEGFPVGTGYQKPIYLLPMYQHKRVYNQTNYPFSLIDHPTQHYSKGICPITESMYESELVTADICRIPYSKKDIDDFLEAVNKIWLEKECLQTYEKNHLSLS